MTPEALKSLIAPVQAAFTAGDQAAVRAALQSVIAPDAEVHLSAPFGSGTGPEALWGAVAPLWLAMPDLERRALICLAGTTPEGQDWIGICGNYMGTFTAPWLDIPPTGHLVHMRFHEFFRVQGGRIVEIQAIWDIPEVMMQAGAWPMAPQLGRFLCTPGPMTQDGLTASGDGQATMRHVLDMLTALCRHPADPDPAVMELERFWHPSFNWYGPAGIGTARGIAGFRNWHQIPFLTAMPDRGLDTGGLHSHWIAEGAYTCETGWPNMRLTLTHDGWLGLPPTGQPITLRSLDFWRMEAGLIRENWVLVDLLDMYAQLGIDVFARMRAFNKARAIMPLTVPKGYPQ
jgi:predicted ester cyclase